MYFLVGMIFDLSWKNEAILESEVIQKYSDSSHQCIIISVADIAF